MIVKFRCPFLTIAVPPEIHPERLNITANIDETVILACNTTGIPEPVVAWVKMPNIDIIGSEDSKILFNGFYSFLHICEYAKWKTHVGHIDLSINPHLLSFQSLIQYESNLWGEGDSLGLWELEISSSSRNTPFLSSYNYHCFYCFSSHRLNFCLCSIFCLLCLKRHI